MFFTMEPNDVVDGYVLDILLLCISSYTLLVIVVLFDKYYAFHQLSHPPIYAIFRLIFIGLALLVPIATFSYYIYHYFCDRDCFHETSTTPFYRKCLVGYTATTVCCNFFHALATVGRACGWGQFFNGNFFEIENERRHENVGLVMRLTLSNFFVLKRTEAVEEENPYHQRFAHAFYKNPALKIWIICVREFNFITGSVRSVEKFHMPTKGLSWHHVLLDGAILERGYYFLYREYQNNWQGNINSDTMKLMLVDDRSYTDQSGVYVKCIVMEHFYIETPECANNDLENVKTDQLIVERREIDPNLLVLLRLANGHQYAVVYRKYAEENSFSVLSEVEIRTRGENFWTYTCCRSKEKLYFMSADKDVFCFDLQIGRFAKAGALNNANLCFSQCDRGFFYSRFVIHFFHEKPEKLSIIAAKTLFQSNLKRNGCSNYAKFLRYDKLILFGLCPDILRFLSIR